MKKKIIIIAFSIISAGIFLSVNKLSEVLPRFNKIKPSFIIGFFILVFIEHIFRALRWQVLLKNSHSGVKLIPVLMALFMSFFSNIFIPHSGIITRLTYLKRFYKFPPSVNIGTFMAEKTSDAVVVILLLSFTSLYSGFSFLKIIDFSRIYENLILISIVASLFFLAVYSLVNSVFKVHYLALKSTIRFHLQSVFSGFHGFKDRKSLFLISFYSIIIWSIYIYSFHLMFSSVEIKADPICLINTASIGNLSWIFPSQAGIGAFHLAVSTTLNFHGYSEADSSFLAILTHSGILITDFVFGLFALLITTFWSFRFSKPALPETIMAVAE